MEEVIDIVSAAGGEFIGINRLQKTAYLLEKAGLGTGYVFRCESSSPYSDDLERDAHRVRLYHAGFDVSDRILEGTGSLYHVFTYNGENRECEKEFRMLVRETAKSHPLTLELASVATHFDFVGHENPWKEAELRNRLHGRDGKLRLDDAMKLHDRLAGMGDRNPIPKPPDQWCGFSKPLTA